jgi:hypothetical protein
VNPARHAHVGKPNTVLHVALVALSHPPLLASPHAGGGSQGPCATHARTSDVTYVPGVVVLSTAHWRKRVDEPFDPTGHPARLDPATTHVLHVDHESVEQSTPPMLTDGAVDSVATDVANVWLRVGDSRSLAMSSVLSNVCAHPAS